MDDRVRGYGGSIMRQDMYDGCDTPLESGVMDDPGRLMAESRQDQSNADSARRYRQLIGRRASGDIARGADDPGRPAIRLHPHRHQFVSPAGRVVLPTARTRIADAPTAFQVWDDDTRSWLHAQDKNIGVPT